MYVSKFYTLAASAVLQLAAGAAYTFSLYAPSLKTRLQLSQPQLEGVGSALLSGGLFAWAPGFVYDSLVPYHKLGPRQVPLDVYKHTTMLYACLHKSYGRKDIIKSHFSLDHVTTPR